MKSIFNAKVLTEIRQRIDRVEASSRHQWGKMNAAQMLAHCAKVLEMANGTNVPPRVFIGRILGPLVKPSILGERPMPHNRPTDKTFVIADDREFATEKIRLRDLVSDFGNAGETGCTSHEHSFFGRLSPQEWGILTYKHLDHHLRQFGV